MLKSEVAQFGRITVEREGEEWGGKQKEEDEDKEEEEHPGIHCGLIHHARQNVYGTAKGNISVETKTLGQTENEYRIKPFFFLLCCIIVVRNTHSHIFSIIKSEHKEVVKRFNIFVFVLYVFCNFLNRFIL